MRKKIKKKILNIINGFLYTFSNFSHFYINRKRFKIILNFYITIKI